MLTWHLVLVYILMLLYIYIAPGQGQTTSWGQMFMSTESPYHLSFKTISLKYDFKYILNDFIHVYSPRAGTDNPLGTKFWCQQKVLITLPICCQFIRNLILYTFLMILYMYIAPGKGHKTPWEQTFDVSRKPLSLQPFVASFKQISLNSDFIHIF